MNFRQDEEHKDILEMVHEFAVNEVKPLAAEIDRTEEFPMKNVKMMAEMGLMGIPFPEEYGGSGMDTLAYIQTVEEISKYCASTGVILSAHTSLCCTPIYQFGTEEQKQKYLPKLCGCRCRRSLGIKRFKDLYYKCRGGRCIYRTRHDRQVTGNKRDLRFYRGKRILWIFCRKTGG